MQIHTLTGCSPEPLANYLKALGILRLISEQADGRARACWKNDHFCLITTLTRQQLETFFLNAYQPTPLVAPWGKGSGFYKNDDPNLSPLEKSSAPRFQSFREGISAARKLLDQIGYADSVIRAITSCTKTNKSFRSEEQRLLIQNDALYVGLIGQLQGADLEFLECLAEPGEPPNKTQIAALKAHPVYKRLLASAERRFKDLKAKLLPDCRKAWRGPHADWFSAAIVLDEQNEPHYPSLLGTGGNDGRLDFTNNFMFHLGQLFEVHHEAARPGAAAEALLRECLWSEPTRELTSAPIGQYQPGSAGGANSSTGFQDGNLINSWDFVLMMEGSLAFASRATRRLNANNSSGASAPFSVRSQAAGYTSAGDEKAQRGEQWMPLWTQPATYDEVLTIFGEGRMQIHRQQANRPVDVARAISRLGVARGIESFVRYGYLERNGQSNLAVPLGRIQVRLQREADLVDDLARWLDQLQLRSRDKNASSRFVHAERNLANAVFAALTSPRTEAAHWQAVLLACAHIESLQVSGSGIQAGPIPPLRPAWIVASQDGSVEFRLALALASAGIKDKGSPYDSVRHHWLPLEPGARRFKTSDKRLAPDPRVVASGRDFLRDLAAIVERRLVEAAAKGQRCSRLVASAGCEARLEDLSEFLSGSLDLRKLSGLARALMAVQWHLWKPENQPSSGKPGEFPDDSWLALRLVNLPWALRKDLDIPADKQVQRLLHSGEPSRAIQVARRRLAAAGIRPPLEAGLVDNSQALCWAAALAFPISKRTARKAAALLDPYKNQTTETKGLIHA